MYRLDSQSSVDFVGEDFLDEGFIEGEIKSVEQNATYLAFTEKGRPDSDGTVLLPLARVLDITT